MGDVPQELVRNMSCFSALSEGGFIGVGLVELHLK